MFRLTALSIFFISAFTIAIAATCGTAFAANLPEFETTTLFKSLSREASVIESAVAGTQVTCSQSKIQGIAKFVAATKKAQTIYLELTGCKSGANNCTTELAAEEGIIQTEKLEGEIGYLEPAKKGAGTVGFALEPAKAGGDITTFKCGAETYSVNGCFIGTLSPAEKRVEEFQMQFSLGAKKGEQLYSSFEPEVGKKRTCKAEWSFKGGATLEAIALKLNHTIIVKCPNMETVKD